MSNLVQLRQPAEQQPYEPLSDYDALIEWLDLMKHAARVLGRSINYAFRLSAKLGLRWLRARMETLAVSPTMCGIGWGGFLGFIFFQ